MALATAILGGGCFWCTEAVFKELAGVQGVKSGYAGGSLANPSYEAVCTGRTGHAEVIAVTYDPAVISYADLLRVFFATHDPTTLNRQGNDVGTQYRSTIMPATAKEEATARAVMAEIEERNAWGAPLVTTIEPTATFYPAEDYHDDYFARNPNAGYCRVIIAPKVAKMRKEFIDRLKKPAAA